MQDARPARRAEARARIRVVKQRGDRRGQSLSARRRHDHPRVADDFGQGAAVGRHHRHAAGHGFARRQPKTLVDRGHHGNRRRGVVTHEFAGANARHEAHPLAKIQLLQQALGLAAGARFTDHQQFEIGVLVEQAMIGLDEIAQAFERRIRGRGRHKPPRAPRDVGAGAKHRRIDTVVDQAGMRRGSAEVRGDVLPRTLRHGDDMAQAAHDASLHAQKAVPATHREALGERARGAQRNTQIVGNRVVHRGHQGKALVL